MKSCKVTNCKSTEVVYSGVDAFILGIPTETYCYNCANAYKEITYNMTGEMK